MIRLRHAFFSGLLALPMSSCVVYEPLPAYTTSRPASFDRSWNAALDAMQDVGIAVSVADRSTGWIVGKRNNGEVTISVSQQVDGSVSVQFNSKGLAPQDQGLNDRLAQAFNRRMGR